MKASFLDLDIIVKRKEFETELYDTIDKSIFFLFCQNAMSR